MFENFDKVDILDLKPSWLLWDKNISKSKQRDLLEKPLTDVNSCINYMYDPRNSKHIEDNRKKPW